MDGENSTDIYTLPSVKQVSSWKLLYRRGRTAWCFVMTQRGGMGDKKDVLSDQCKEIEENNKIGKTRDRFWRR